MSLLYDETIFQSVDDADRYYFIAKDISEHINIAIDEIKALKDHHGVTGIYVNFNGRKAEISVEFMNFDTQTGRKYSWDFTVDYGFYLKSDYSKTLYFFYNKWSESIQDELGACTNFSFYEH